MTIEQGKVVNVLTYDAGSELVAPAAIGATVLYVQSTYPFSDIGGTLEHKGVEYTYLSIDSDAETITLAAPGLTLAGDEDDDITITPYARNKRAQVVLEDDGEGITAQVPFSMDALFATGIREEWEQESVTISDETGDWVIIGLDGEVPSLDGSYIDPDSTVPVTALTDGEPPQAAPVVTFIGGIGSLFFRWTAVSNVDPVTYRLHINAGSAPVLDGSMEVAAGLGLTWATVRQLRDGTPIDPTGDITYHAIVTISDADGPGPSSATVTGVPAQVTSPDIAVGAITADLMTANEAFVGALNATDFSAIKMTGVTIETRSESQRGVKIGIVTETGGAEPKEGLWVYDDTGNPFLKAIPAEGMAVIAGEVKAHSLTVSPTSPQEGSSLGGVTEITRHPDGTPGVVRLTGFATAPKSAPVLDIGYDTSKFKEAGGATWNQPRYGWSTDGTHWYSARADAQDAYVIEQYDSSGNVVNSHTRQNYAYGQPKSTVAYSDGANVVIYVLSEDQQWWDWVVERWVFNKTTFAVVDHTDHFWVNDQGNRIPAIGWDATNSRLLIAQSRNTDDKVVIRSYVWPSGADGQNLSPTSTLVINHAYPYALSGVLVGTFDMGVTRYVFSNRGGDLFWTADTAGTVDFDRLWPSAANSKNGFAWSGTQFMSIHSDGMRYTYTGLFSQSIYLATVPITVGNTLANATYETNLGATADISVSKRSKLLVFCSDINTGGVNAPDRVHIYISTGSGFTKQTSPATGVTSMTYTVITSDGAAPPATNGFAAAAGTVQRFEFADESLFVDGNKNGSIGTGTFRDSVDARVTTLAPTVTMTTGDVGSGAFRTSVDARVTAIAPTAVKDSLTTTVVNATGAFTGSIRFTKVAGMVFAVGTIQRPTGSNTAFVGVVAIPSGYAPPTTETAGAKPFWNGTAMYRFRRTTTNVEVQQTGVDASNMDYIDHWPAT